MRPIYEAKRRRRFLDRLAPEQTAVQNRPSETKESFVNRLRGTASSERQQFLRDHVAQEVAKVLGVEHPGALDPHQGFFRMGMDSLMSVQLRQRLENILDSRPLPLTLAFEYPNIEALTKYLASEVLDLASPSSRTRVSVKEAGAARPDPHDRLSEDELIDLLAKKMEELE
jgi:myxalamid-type polyketide synthase MxaE and MxaD